MNSTSAIAQESSAAMESPFRGGPDPSVGGPKRTICDWDLPQRRLLRHKVAYRNAALTSGLSDPVEEVAAAEAETRKTLRNQAKAHHEESERLEFKVHELEAQLAALKAAVGTPVGTEQRPATLSSQAAAPSAESQQLVAQQMPSMDSGRHAPQPHNFEPPQQHPQTMQVIHQQQHYHHNHQQQPFGFNQQGGFGTAAAVPSQPAPMAFSVPAQHMGRPPTVSAARSQQESAPTVAPVANQADATLQGASPSPAMPQPLVGSSAPAQQPSFQQYPPQHADGRNIQVLRQEQPPYETHGLGQPSQYSSQWHPGGAAQQATSGQGGLGAVPQPHQLQQQQHLHPIRTVSNGMPESSSASRGPLFPQQQVTAAPASVSVPQEDPEPVLLVDIEEGEGRKGVIEVRKGDTPHRLAEAYAKQRGLNARQQGRLVAALESAIEQNFPVM